MQRNHTIEAIQGNPEKIWDIIIIGGGATGLGAGVDAASRGYQTLVLEQYDFAKGTSSRSTKLVHGGVRYLAQGDIPLVLEALHERGLLKQNAPHLVKNLEFIIPNYDWWAGPFYTAGLKVYDLMAGKLGFGPSIHISKEEAMHAIPNLVEEGLKGGVIYHDGQFDDSRLAVNLAQTIIDKGGYVANYCAVTALLKDAEGMISGVSFHDTESGRTVTVNAQVVVNATGIFVDQIHAMDQPGMPKTVVPSQGVHIVLDKSFLPGDSAIMIPKTEDGRVLFAVPWHNQVILGTTDTPGVDVSIEPRAQEEEIDFILNTAAVFLRKAPKRSDALSIFAGLRPLAAPEQQGEATKEISRGHKLTISHSGLISIIGGKWTTYRRMGEEIVDKAILLGGLQAKPCVTEHMPIHGALETSASDSCLAVYGTDAAGITEIIQQHPALAECLHSDLPYIKAEVIWAVREEMALCVEDFLARRTRALFLNAQASMDMAPAVAKLMAQELGFEQNWEEQQVRLYQDNARGYLLD